jgi:ArsR family transcriptional regulator
MTKKFSINENLKKEDEALAKFLRIIGDNNRLKIIYLLKDRELCVCKIYPRLNLAQNLVSSHLKIMINFDLLKIRKEWKNNYYSLNQKTFNKYSRLLDLLLKKNNKKIEK